MLADPARLLLAPSRDRIAVAREIGLRMAQEQQSRHA
jgi:hypothetical protein